MHQAPTDLHAQAQARVQRKLGFGVHLLVFCIVNGGLALLRWQRGDASWMPWPMWGWGIGLMAHGLATWASLAGEGLRQRMVAQELQSLERRGQ